MHRVRVLSVLLALTSLASVSGNGAVPAGALLWFHDARLTDAGQVLLQELLGAEHRGLRPEDYDAAGLRALVDSVTRAPAAAEIARADHALTAAAERFASDLRQGRVSPAQVGYDLDLKQPPFDASAEVVRLANSKDLSASLDALEPSLRHYALLKRALAEYRALAAEPDLPRLPALPRKSIREGESYTGAPALRRLLTAMRDLPAGPAGSGASTETFDTHTFDTATSDALAHFQMRVGLEPDGVLGAKTYRALTTPLSRRVEQIELALERVRWLPRTFDAPPIIVNIPQFRLFAFRTKNDFAADILQMDVIVGATFDGRETPIFAADMRYVVLNPYWDVPHTIMRKELLPEIEADRNWVARMGYEIVSGPGDDARVVPATDENIRRLAQGKLRLRQVPGPGNALGRVKFVFPNRHNVYLHDTPGKHLFEARGRAFSHGCVRVADPVALLTHVLKGDSRWTAERITQALAGPPALRIALPRPIPVFILYSTALATEANDVLFFEDIYGQDAKLGGLLMRQRSRSDGITRTSRGAHESRRVPA